MAVAAENEVRAAFLKDGNGVEAHLDLFSFKVRVVRSVAVRWVMPEGDDPILRRSGQIGPQPCEHWTVRETILTKGVEANKMRIAIIKRVIRFCSRRRST